MKQKIYQTLIELTNGPFTSTVLKKFSQSQFSKPLIKPYAKFYQINLEEMVDNLNDFKNLHSFFIRKLKQNARHIDKTEQTVSSPVDGVIEAFGEITPELQIVVKNKSYSMIEMLGNRDQAVKYEQGHYLILYLSPAHYHRIHSPLTGKVVRTYTLGKKSFPVNRLGLKYGQNVLAKNYRVITELENRNTRIAMVKVGAMFVNSIVVENKNNQWLKGEEVAYFSFGSTVVLLFQRDAFKLYNPEFLPREVKVGEVLGTLS